MSIDLPKRQPPAAPRKSGVQVPVQVYILIFASFVIIGSLQLLILIWTEQRSIITRERQEIKIISDTLEKALINIARSSTDIAINSSVIQLIALDLDKIDPELKDRISSQADSIIKSTLANNNEFKAISIFSVESCQTYSNNSFKKSNKPLWEFKDWDRLASLKPSEVILQPNPSDSSRGFFGLKLTVPLFTSSSQVIGALLIKAEIPVTTIMRTKGLTNYLLVDNKGEIIAATGEYQKIDNIGSIFGKASIPAFVSHSTDSYIHSNQIIVLNHVKFGNDLQLTIISVELNNLTSRYAAPVIFGMFTSMLLTYMVYMIMLYSLKQRVSPRVVAKLHREQSELMNVLQYTNSQLGDPREIAKLLVPEPSYIAKLVKKYNIELNYLSRPAGFIGGDLWGTVESPDNRLLIYLIDVCGHGVQAGLETLSMRAILEDSIIHGLSTSEAINRLNRAVEHLFLPGRFITMMIVEIDRNHDMCEIYCMGANYVMIQNLVKQDTVMPTNQGAMLGLFEKLNIGRHSIPWLSGTRITLFSDGLSEVRDRKGNILGSEKLNRIATKYYSNNQTEVLASLEAAWAQQKGLYNQEDDLTIIVIDAQ